MLESCETDHHGETSAVIQERGSQGERQEHEYEVSIGAWQGRAQNREWEHETLQRKENLVVPGTEATERNLMTMDDIDTSMAKGRLNGAILLAEHVEKIKGHKMDRSNKETLRL